MSLLRSSPVRNAASPIAAARVPVGPAVLGAVLADEDLRGRVRSAVS